MTEKEGEFVCTAACTAPQDLSLPDVTQRWPLKTLNFSSLPLFLPLLPSFLPSLSPSPFLSHSPSIFPFSSVLPAVFGSKQQERRGSSPPIVSVLRGTVDRTPPSLCLSPLPPVPFALFSLLAVFLSSPCCEREHTCLILAACSPIQTTPTGPVSHIVVSFWKSSSSHRLQLHLRGFH